MVEKDEKSGIGWRTRVGLAGTAVWLSLAIWWTFYRPSEAWGIPSAMQPNAWGDWAAGTFAPLAFLWLVLGYFQQGEELRDNVRALRLQEKALQLQVAELRDSVKQQSELARATTKQAELLEKSQAVALRAQLLPHQPKFAAFDHKKFTGARTLGLRIVNTGVPCDDATIMVTDEAGSPDLLIKVGAWGARDERFYAADPTNLQFPIVRLVEISYTDALLIPQSQRFRIEFVKKDDGEILADAHRLEMTFNLPAAESASSV